MIHTVKGSSIVKEGKVDVFLDFPCFFYYPKDVGNLISGSSAFSKPSLYIWKFSVHVLLKPSLRILSITLLACEMSTSIGSLNILWHCLSLELEWNWPFPVLVASAEVSKFAYMECIILTASFSRILNNSPGIWSPPQKELFTHKWAAVGLCDALSSLRGAWCPPLGSGAEGWGWRMGYWLFSVSLFKRWELKGEDYATPNMPLWRHKLVLNC